MNQKVRCGDESGCTLHAQRVVTYNQYKVVLGRRIFGSKESKPWPKWLCIAHAVMFCMRDDIEPKVVEEL